MAIPSDNNHEAVCSITELARKLPLSRVRFHQLMKKGVFPAPLYCPRSKRPFYPLDLQQQCINIRRTGIGYNGQPVLFYASRKSKSRQRQNQSPRESEELADILREMRQNVTPDKVRDAIKTLWPEGLTGKPDKRLVIRSLLRYFRSEL